MISHAPLSKWAGRLLAALGLAFVAWVAIGHGQRLAAYLDSGAVLLALAASLIPALLAMLAVFWGWRQLLSWLAFGALPTRDAFVCYGYSNISKYLPGNVFHLVSRQLLGSRMGVPQRVLIGSSVLEFGLITAVATAIALTVLWAPAAIGALLVTAVGAVAAFSYRREACAWLRRRLGVELAAPRHLAAAIASYVVFFALSGLTLLLILAPTGAGGLHLLPRLIAISGAAFVAGFVVPGAPAGFGVRESVMLLLLKEASGEPQALLATLGSRLSWILADLLVFAAAAILGRGARP